MSNATAVGLIKLKWAMVLSLVNAGAGNSILGFVGTAAAYPVLALFCMALTGCAAALTVYGAPAAAGALVFGAGVGGGVAFGPPKLVDKANDAFCAVVAASFVTLLVVGAGARHDAGARLGVRGIAVRAVATALRGPRRGALGERGRGGRDRAHRRVAASVPVRAASRCQRRHSRDGRF